MVFARAAPWRAGTRVGDHGGMESAIRSPGTSVRHRPRLADAVLSVGAIGFTLGLVAMFTLVDDRSNTAWYAGALVTFVSAVVVRLRRPDHPLAIWFCVLAATLPWQYVTMDLLRWSNASDRSPWIPATLALATRLATAIAIAAATRLFVRFPDGRWGGLTERRAVRAVDVVQVVSCVVLLATPLVAWPTFLGGEVVANPLQVPGISISVGTAMAIADLANAMVIVGLVLLVRRYVRSDQPDRKQIRWLLLPLIAAVVGLFGELLIGSGHIGTFSSTVVSAALGIGIAFGIVRPEGIDVDNVLRSSVVWGLLWLAITSAYVGVSAAFGLTAGQRWSVGWAVAITVLAMLALFPVRAALQRITSRWFFGPPPDPRRAIVRLGDSLASTYDLETLLPEIAAALEDGLGVEWARVRLSPGSAPDTRVPELVVPIVLDGDELGVVECGPKRTGAIDEEDEAIVRTFARQAAAAVRNVRLTTQLLDHADELAASRARLVRAEETERRRIEQNIHDGVQQNLVALIGQTGMIRQGLERDGPPGDDHLVESLKVLQSGLQRLLSELRELASGIHPTVLRNRGLLAAVEALAARNPVPLNVRADPELRDLRLPIEVEGAGYYTVAESLANSLKHSDASRLDITLSRSNGSLSIQISDDGIGFDPERVNGNGLANLTERVAALDGSLTVHSQSGHGTTVSATLPISERTP